MNPIVYLETTIIGYLAMQPSGALRIVPTSRPRTSGGRAIAIVFPYTSRDSWSANARRVIRSPRLIACVYEPKCRCPQRQPPTPCISPTLPSGRESNRFVVEWGSSPLSFAPRRNFWRSTMETDPVVAEVRAVREQLAARLGFRLHDIVKEARRQDAAGDRKVVRLPPRRPIAAAVDSN